MSTTEIDIGPVPHFEAHPWSVVPNRDVETWRCLRCACLRFAAHKHVRGLTAIRYQMPGESPVAKMPRCAGA